MSKVSDINDLMGEIEVDSALLKKTSKNVQTTSCIMM